MSTTRKSTTKRDSKPQQPKLQNVGPDLALEMLRSALVYLELAGIQMTYRNEQHGLRLQLEGVEFREKRFMVGTEKGLVVQPAQDVPPAI